LTLGRKKYGKKTTHQKTRVPIWASAHRGKWGQLTPRKKMDEKLKSENMQKREQSGQAGVENGAIW